MKKLFSILPLILLLSFSVSFWSPVRSPMNDIWLYFCNEWTDPSQLTKDSQLTIAPGGSKDLCLYFSNNSNEAMTFIYWFAKWYRYDVWSSTCDQDDSENSEFGVLIPKTSDRKVTIPANSSQVVKEKIQIPLWLEWEKIWCIAYKLWKPETQVWWMFNIVFRKALAINILIAWDSDMKNSIKLNSLKSDIFSSNKKIKASVDSKWNLNIDLSLQNDWNMDQNVNIKWRIYNALWFEKTFEFKDKLVSAWRTELLNSNLWILPTYKWIFNVEFTLNSEVKSKFDISKLKWDFKPTTMTESWTIFIFTWIWLIVAAVILLIIYMLLRPLLKKHPAKETTK